MTDITLVEMHDLADAIERLLGLFGLAVPDAPVQPLDLCDDRDLGLLASRFVGEQSACRQFRVLQPHGDVEPGCDRLRGDAGVGKNRPQSGTPVGERSHLCGSGSADCLKAAVSLNRNVGAGPGDGTKDLPPAVGCLDVANANFQMPVTFLTATNECRVRGEVMLMAAAIGLAVGMSPRCSPILSVWARNVSGLMPTSARRRCVSTSAATRKGISAERWARSRSNSGVDRQCDGQVTQRAM